MCAARANRATGRPRPEEWADNELMTLMEAAAVFWPNGPLTIASLRTEIRAGRLTAEFIAGKLFVTPAALRDMRRRCRARQKAPASSSASAPAEHPSSSSSILAGLRSAQAVALESVRERRRRLRAT